MLKISLYNKTLVAAFILSTSFFMSFLSLSYAQSLIPSGKAVIRMEKQQDRVANLKARADTEIARRIDGLDNVKGKLVNLKKLSTDQKNSLSSQIDTEVSNLTTLKAKIDTDTDLTTLRTDVKSIINSYRVFALFIPKINIIKISEDILAISSNFDSYVLKLQDRIQKAQSKGIDVATANSTLIDMRAKITDAKLQANNAINAVIGLTPDGYPGNKTTLRSARSMLQIARQDLKNARLDANSVIQLTQSKTLAPASTK